MATIAAALLGACVTDDGTQSEFDFHTATLQQDPIASDVAAENVAAEAVTLYQELAARLEARGVTHDELQAAVDAGDADASGTTQTLDRSRSSHDYEYSSCRDRHLY